MRSVKKILGLTSIRSEYDLMSGLYRRLHADENVDLKLLVSGAHLSKTYGRSVSLIEQDGFDILHTIETLIDSDFPGARLKSASLFLQNSIDIVARYNPDLIIYAGDREDVIMGALLGGFLNIPTAHFYGGDHVQDCHIDNPVRHATSKLSSIHMVCIEEHRERLIRMGENPERIFTIGSIALDRFRTHQPMTEEELLQNFDLPASFRGFVTLIFHPVSKETAYSHLIFKNILETLKHFSIPAFVSAPNTDPGNHEILRTIEQYRSDSNFYFYRNLDRDTFLSIYKRSRFLIGNSSSGIYEAASVPMPVVNVGLRQVGRRANENVIFCGTEPEDIARAVSQATSDSFLGRVRMIRNLYGDGQSTQRAHEILVSTDFRRWLYKDEDPLKL